MVGMAAVAASVLFVRFDVTADEGMYPISELHRLNLKQLGFRIDAKTLYNPNGVSLIDAIVQVGGCTGSFVSNEGLVITNHHCVFGSVSSASTKENDYVTEGFLAAERSKELPARGMTIRITQYYRDVSKEVLGAVDDAMPLAERARAIQKKMSDIGAEAEKQNPGKQAQVSEMFAGRTYVLFIYDQIKDVRLVYVPQRSIGEFGGEDDNWVWPRHTGDFSFVRAYVAPDGSPSEYSEKNVPYKPRTFLKVNANGVDENDFVFILGYPGRTFRHQPSGFLKYDEQVRLKYVAEFFDWQIRLMERAGKDDRATAMKFEPRIKGLANTMKNFRGKVKGLERLQLVQRKLDEEKALQGFIEGDEQRKVKYRTVLKDLNSLYDEMLDNAGRELFLDAFASTPTLFTRASTIYEAALERQKPDSQRATAFSDKNLNAFRQSLKRSYSSHDDGVDRAIFTELLRRGSLLKGSERIGPLEAIATPTQSGTAFVDRVYSASALRTEDGALGMLDKPLQELEGLNDPFIALAKAMRPIMQELREVRQRRNGAISKLYPLYLEVKESFQKASFIPDANSTLRLTFGRIKGYSPVDATSYAPITTLTGVLQKSTGEPPYYNTPQKLIDQARAKNYGRFAHKRLKDVPVGILYNTDTTGGNSGSPVMDAGGELVGVNFDRAYEATINDYAWSDSYSRSIAVDIRYVLWVTEKVGGAGYLLNEMGVN